MDSGLQHKTCRVWQVLSLNYYFIMSSEVKTDHHRSTSIFIVATLFENLVAGARRLRKLGWCLRYKAREKQRGRRTHSTLTELLGTRNAVDEVLVDFTTRKTHTRHSQDPLQREPTLPSNLHLKSQQAHQIPQQRHFVPQLLYVHLVRI